MVPGKSQLQLDFIIPVYFNIIVVVEKCLVFFFVISNFDDFVFDDLVYCIVQNVGAGPLSMKTGFVSLFHIAMDSAEKTFGPHGA